MQKRNCFVISQSRTDSEYNDFVGKFYHFSKRYLNQLSTPDVEFVYYETKTRGDGVYFGYGKIKRIFEDKLHALGQSGRRSRPNRSAFSGNPVAVLSQSGQT